VQRHCEQSEAILFFQIADSTSSLKTAVLKYGINATICLPSAFYSSSLPASPHSGGAANYAQGCTYKQRGKAADRQIGQLRQDFVPNGPNVTTIVIE